MKMTTEEITTKVLELIERELGHYHGADNETNLKTRFDDLGMDSLDRVELVMAAEEDFGIALEDEEWEALETKTIADAVGLIESKL